MQQPQSVQTHHQVVEEILPEQMSDEVTKEVINQFLPQRKRKPRQPKQPGKQQPAQKIIKLEPQASGSETITTVTTNIEQGSEMIVEEQEQQQQQVGTEMVEQVVTGGEEQIVNSDQNTSTVSVKTEGTPKTPKDKSNSKKRNFIPYLQTFRTFIN
jgi:hypothetical protein